MLQLNKRKTHQTSRIANRKRLKLIKKKVMTARKVQRRKKRLLRKNLLKWAKLLNSTKSKTKNTPSSQVKLSRSTPNWPSPRYNRTKSSWRSLKNMKSISKKSLKLETIWSQPCTDSRTATKNLTSWSFQRKRNWRTWRKWFQKNWNGWTKTRGLPKRTSSKSNTTTFSRHTPPCTTDPLSTLKGNEWLTQVKKIQRNDPVLVVHLPKDAGVEQHAFLAGGKDFQSLEED